jgi:hypothetical protein
LYRRQFSILSFMPHPNFVGKKGRSGPKPGSQNGLRNGAHVNRHRLVVGELPHTMSRVKVEGRQYRRALEAAVLTVKGQVTLSDAHVIDAAVGATMGAAVCRWLLRNRLSEMTVSDIVACNREMAKQKASRASIVKTLGLDRDANLDVLDALYKRLPGPDVDTSEEVSDGPAPDSE